jgi:hypothetical protein
LDQTPTKQFSRLITAEFAFTRARRYPKGFDRNQI